MTIGEYFFESSSTVSKSEEELGILESISKILVSKNSPPVGPTFEFLEED